MPPKPAKKPVSKPNGGQSIPTQTTTSAQNNNKAPEHAQNEEEDIILDSAPAPTPEDVNAMPSKIKTLAKPKIKTNNLMTLSN